MDARFQRRIQRYGWDKAAGYYEQCWQQQLHASQTRFLEMAAPQHGERVLETACGTGLVTFPLAGLVGPEGDVVATDISESMVNSAEVRSAELGLTNTTFHRMGAEQLVLDSDSFDLALCSLGLMYVPDTLTALKEMFKVLKPGGRVAVLIWGRRAQCGWAEIFPIVDARVESEVCPLFFQLGAEGVLETEMGTAGFTNIRLTRFNDALEFLTAEEACIAIFLGGPVALAYDRFDEPTREEAHGEYLESIAAFRTGKGYKIPGEFVIALGEKPGG